MNEEADVRLPPHDLDAEEALLGSLLIDPNAYFKVFNIVRAGDFYREKHRWVYEACAVLFNNNYNINQITVAHELARNHRLEASGGADFMSHLISSTPSSVHLEHYAHIVWRTSVMRKLINAAAQIEKVAYSIPYDVDDALDKVKTIIESLSDPINNKDKNRKSNVGLRRYQRG